MSGGLIKICLRVLGLTLCILPAAVATLEHFPIWIGDGVRPTLSAISLILLAMTAVPLKRIITKYIESPAAWFMWLAVWIITSLLSGIVEGVASIALVAFVGNLLGSICFKLAKERTK